MKTINIELEKNHFIKIIKRLSDKDRLEIYDELKKTLFLKRFNLLLKQAKTNKLSLEEITKEVETVRQIRYEEGRHKS